MSILVPLLAIPISAALVVGGIVAYRQGKEVATRSVGAAAIATGVAIAVIVVLGGMMLYAV